MDVFNSSTAWRFAPHSIKPVQLVFNDWPVAILQNSWHNYKTMRLGAINVEHEMIFFSRNERVKTFKILKLRFLWPSLIVFYRWKSDWTLLGLIPDRRSHGMFYVIGFCDRIPQVHMLHMLSIFRNKKSAAAPGKLRDAVCRRMSRDLWLLCTF